MLKPHLLLFTTTLLTALTGCLVMLPGATATGENTALQEFQQTFNQRRPRGEGIRRGGLCALSPGTDVLQKEFVIWSDRPLFLWQAEGRQITVQRLRVLDSATEAIVWEQALQPSDRKAAYTGRALQPGQVYSWELAFQRSPATPTSDVVEYRFQVMNGAQRNQIATELQALTSRLQASGATPEAIAIQQGRYFANLGLLSDALQILHALKSPSTETTKLLQDLTNSVCNAGNVL